MSLKINKVCEVFNQNMKMKNLNLEGYFSYGVLITIYILFKRTNN